MVTLCNTGAPLVTRKRKEFLDDDKVGNNHQENVDEGMEMEMVPSKTAFVAHTCTTLSATTANADVQPSTSVVANALDL